MRRPQAETIVLGGETWTVRPLTVAQVQAIEPLLFDGSGKAGNVAAAVAILRVALARDHAEAASGLDNVEAGASEIATAMAIVLRLGGFLPPGETAGEKTPPGEALAGAEPASTGRPSTPA